MSANILAFGMPGGPEMILIFILVLLLFGAKKLPQLARGIGKSAGEFKKAKDEFEHQIKSAADDAEHVAIEAGKSEEPRKESSNLESSDSAQDSDTDSQS
ncbi:MAG: twin-arginine translocase TatA/TatE family subunit [Verrucomicrobiaceae bacterium]|nr:twin-arginine translocase TatA/TatE family subunit [Verrucomicrobiaceae bacterium]